MIKIIVNGKEIQMPNEIDGLLSHILKDINIKRKDVEQKEKPQFLFPQYWNPPINSFEDIEAREVIFGLDQRIKNIEKYLESITKKKVTKPPVKKVIKTPIKKVVKKPVKKVIKKYNINGKKKSSKNKNKSKK